MPNKRVIEAGHLLAMVFVALLLAGANQYLGAHPFIAGLLLAAFAAPYYTAARITGERRFLYPAVLLLVLAYHLLLHGMGIAPALQPLFALLPVAFIYTIAGQNLLHRPERASQALYGANGVLIGAMALWILVRLPWFYHQAPLATALALAGFCAYAWFRFRATGRILHSLALVLLGSGAYLVFLYWQPQLAVLLATVAGLLIWGLFYRRADGPALPRLETGALLAAGAYLIYMGTAAAGRPPDPALIPFGYLVAASIWLQLALALSRPEQPDVLGPHPAVLPCLLPLFGAGIALALAGCPLGQALFDRWTPIAPAVAYLAVFSFVFAATGSRLAQGSRSLIGVAAARLIAGLGRMAPLAALAYIAVQRFPAGLRLALGALSLGLVSLLWAYRQRPKLFVRRNYYAYQTGIFLILACFLVERRLAAAGSPVDLAAGAGSALVVLATAWLLRKRVTGACRLSLYEVASMGAIVAALLYPLRNPIDPFLRRGIGAAAGFRGRYRVPGGARSFRPVFDSGGTWLLALHRGMAAGSARRVAGRSLPGLGPRLGCRCEQAVGPSQPVVSPPVFHVVRFGGRVAGAVFALPGGRCLVSPIVAGGVRPRRARIVQPPRPCFRLGIGGRRRVAGDRRGERAALATPLCAHGFRAAGLRAALCLGGGTPWRLALCLCGRGGRGRRLLPGITGGGLGVVLAAILPCGGCGDSPQSRCG